MFIFFRQREYIFIYVMIISCRCTIEKQGVWLTQTLTKQVKKSEFISNLRKKHLNDMSDLRMVAFPFLMSDALQISVRKKMWAEELLDKDRWFKVRVAD
jgi:hypothetical protein